MFHHLGGPLAFASLFRVYQNMAGSRRKGIPKRRGRPATGRDPVVPVRLPAEFIARIDNWGAKQAAHSRSEAIRRLVEIGLSVATSSRPHSSKLRGEAAKLANDALDRHSDQSATHEQRESRKRKLLKGPKEFRQMREDHK